MEPLLVIIVVLLILIMGLLYYLREMRRFIRKSQVAPSPRNVPAHSIRRKPIQETKEKERYQENPAMGVGQFYDEQTDNFIKVYGEVIQAFRTRNLDNLLNYQIESIGLQPGQKVLDAGCGVCGPALYFAQQVDVEIEAITISAVQVEKAKLRIRAAGLENKVKVQQCDYHLMDECFPANSFDVIYFLESFGHSHDKGKLLDAAWEVLKPGGSIYIKDLFLKEPVLEGHQVKMQQEVDKINSAYHYNLADLYDFLRYVRKKGYILGSLKTIDLPLDDFENLTISNDFQELTGIARIDNWKEYIFPVDFFELKLYKPWHDLKVGNSRYFLQNLYYLQVHNRGEDSL